VLLHSTKLTTSFHMPMCYYPTDHYMKKDIKTFSELTKDFL